MKGSRLLVAKLAMPTIWLLGIMYLLRELLGNLMS